MSLVTELSGVKQDELLREAVSRQTHCTLSCKGPTGWETFNSILLSLDRNCGDLVVAMPSGPESLDADVVQGHSLGVSFRRGSRKYVFETQLTGRCTSSTGRTEESPALRLLWPTCIFEMQRRLYYRTAVPDDFHLPVEAWRWDASASGETQTLQGRMLDLSASGISFALSPEDNPRWAVNTPVGCSFLAPGGERLELFGHARYASPTPSSEIRLGIQFVGLETPESSRQTLERVLDLTNQFQKMEMRRVARV